MVSHRPPSSSLAPRCCLRCGEIPHSRLPAVHGILFVLNRNADSFPSDYINPIDLCNRLNTYIVPEAAVHAFLTFLFLINGYWLALLLNLPLLAWNAKKIFENQHLLDATEIFRKLNYHKKVRWLPGDASGPGLTIVILAA